MIAFAHQEPLWGVALIVGDRQTAEDICRALQRRGATVRLLRVDAERADLINTPPTAHPSTALTSPRDVLLPLAIALAAGVIAVLLM